MTRTTPRLHWRRAGVGLALCCLLSATALSATAAEGDDPVLPAPPEAPAASAEAIAAGSDTPAELLAVPRAGSPAAVLAGGESADQLEGGATMRGGAQSATELGGSFSGTITGLIGASVQPLPSAMVSAVQWNESAGTYDLIASATADANGHYSIGGLAPGDYLMMADDNDPGLALLPEYWEDAPIAAWATYVTVADGVDTPGIDETLEPLLKEYIAGANRYDTSVAISQSGWADGAGGCVYIASGANFPDALSAAPAAATCGGPLLLVPPTTTTPGLEAELERLQPDEIVIAGGTGAVSASVQTALQAFAPTVRRIAGTDRYDTSRKLVADAFGSGAPALWVATGANFPDALSASGAASAAYLPVLIVPGTAGGLDTASANAIKNLGAGVVAIAGGTGVVSTGVEAAIEALPSVEAYRFGGGDRYATSLAINAAVWDVEAGAYSVYAFLTNGLKFPDALSGAPLAGGLLGAPLYVVPPVCTPAGVVTHLGALGVYEAYLLGYFSQLSFNGKPFQTC